MVYKIEKRESVLIFTINRPDKKNAINYEVMDGLSKAIEQSTADDAIKALVITGSGSDAFCSGGDLQAFHALKTAEEAHSMLSKMGEILYELSTLSKITVALLNGTAVGGGCEIAAACDFRIAYPKIKMGFVQANLSITTGWGGGTLLYERIQPADALHILTAADFYSAEELFEKRFIDFIVQERTLEEAMNLLQPILLKNVHVLSAYKKMMTEKWKKGDLHERMKMEIQACSVLWGKESHHEAVERFLNSSSRKNTKS
ncbi:enoyl-CoA hydratase/isomerase family protein [Jeotgalibacillus campisalis]|uniref:Enoyl-CoA hydratase n=1 Tax=Jeotgalibacillus campisalis TaxID=220754 RepID=A0A0C2VT49_9BACL|nr:enoyl-CoA hydratase/isomerase family protein [Jeotgalibacillus campisalis]KIL47611.1 enoyl-CoA hydratase [Jeotgalibacillus campisalis]